MSQTLPLCETSSAHLTTHLLFSLRATTDLPPVLDGVEAEMGRYGFDTQEAFAVRLALEEALVNAIKHGHRYDSTKVVRARCRVTDEEVWAEVQDEGPGFDPTRVADPTAPENVDRPCGRGLLLMRHYMTWVRYDERGSRVTLCKRRARA